MKVLTIVSVAGLLLAIATGNDEEFYATAYSDKHQVMASKSELSYNAARLRCIIYGSDLLHAHDGSAVNAIIPFLNPLAGYWIATPETDSREWFNRFFDRKGLWNRENEHPDARNYGNDCLLNEKGGWSFSKCSESQSFICQKAFEPLKDSKFFYKSHFFHFHRKFSDRTDFRGAMDKCKESASQLALVNSQELSDEIKRNIEKGLVYYWIGGSETENEGDWKWNNEETIQNFDWMEKRPNEKDARNCLAIAKLGWVDLACSRKARYICEKVGASGVKVSDSAVEVSAEGDSNVTCDANGSPAPVVAWHRNETAVSTRVQLIGVFQTLFRAGAILQLGGASILDEGSYVCRAQNTIEGTLFSDMASSYVSVPSYADIVRAFGHACNSTITILWRPNKRARNTLHRITWESKVSGPFTNTIAPQGRQKSFSTYVIQNLSENTYYNITISPRPMSTKWKSRYAVSTLVLTGGLPPAISLPRVSTILLTSCVVTWTKPEPVYGNLTYQVTIKEATVNTGSNSGGLTYNISRNGTSFTFFGKPDREYSFGVKAKACGRFGPIVFAKETCKTSKPESSRTLSSSGTLTTIIASSIGSVGGVGLLLAGGFILKKWFSDRRNNQAPSSAGTEETRRETAQL